MPKPSPYRYALIGRTAPRDQVAAPRAETLGIEVTDLELAAQCGLGNIDPQHTPSSCGQLPEDAPAAIEVALAWPLPRVSATLVTIRPDVDSIGAMAVLALRAQGTTVAAAMQERIALVARWDRFEMGSWDNRRSELAPLLRPAQLVDLGLRPLALRALGLASRDPRLTVSQRVRIVAEWLTDGTLPPDYVAGALRDEEGLLAAWNRGAITIAPTASPRVVLLRSRLPNALAAIGYRFAPVVVGEAEMAWGRKLTVAQFEPGWLDMTALLAQLNAIEPGWGGSGTIIGSPIGEPCSQSLETVAARAISLLLPRPGTLA